MKDPKPGGGIELVSPQQLSDILGVPEHTLAQWRYLGKGPAYLRVGRFVRYEAAEVRAWLEQQKRGQA